MDHDLMRLSAVDRYRRDQRFRALADSVVAAVMQEHGPVDPDRADREACDIAQSAVALLLERVLTDDAELAHMRAERDRYRKIAEDALSTVLPRLLMPAPPA